MKDRIKQIMEAQRLTQQEFANTLELSPATLSSIFNGRTNPTLNIVDAIKKKFPAISTDWLMFGSGSMYGDHSGDIAQGHDSAPDGGEQVIDFGDAPQTAPTPSAVNRAPQQGQQPTAVAMKNIYKAQRNITEIRIFYDDQTWETFVPKKWLFAK